MKKVKVIIAEDHYLTAKLLQLSLSRTSNISVVGVATNGKELIDLVRKNEVDVILMDINMPYLDGIQAMDAIFRVNSLVRILVLSGHTEAWVIRHSLNSGASGYLTKKVSQVEIIDAIMAVHEGGAYLDMMSLDVILNDFDLTDEEESKSNPKKYSMN